MFGTIFLLSRQMPIQLLSGDCLEVMRDLSDGSIDCFICDLPYGCLTPCGVSQKHPDKYPPGTKSGGCSWDIKIDLEAFWKEVKRLAKDDHTPVLMFCTTKFGYELIKSNESWFRYDLVWDKGQGVSFLSANKMPMRSHEMVYVFSKKGAYYKRVDIEGDFKKWKREREHQHSTQYGGAKRNDTEGGDGKRCVLSVIKHPKSSTKQGHPTEKPLDLYTWLLKRYCPEGGTVLDPTAGSFNCCFAAHALGLNAIGIEKDPDFFKKALEVYESSLGQSEHLEASQASDETGQSPDMLNTIVASPPSASPEFL